MSHRLRGAIVAACASLALGFLMFFPRVLSFGIALGFALLLVLLAGILDFMGALRIERAAPAGDRGDRTPASLKGAPAWLRIVAGFHVPTLYVGIALLAAAACRLSVIGTLGAGYPWSGPVLAAAGIAAIGIARWRRRPFDGELHVGFLVFSVAAATVMATLGSHGLWDCWETHYGEVARRQLEQDDWISLFWENEWFYSKPILIFWLMNLGMALFGVQIGPDSISGHAEWGVRFFVGALAVAVIWSVYRLLSRRVSRTAGLFGAIAISTMPLFAFMARQSITDLPFVGLMTIAVALFLLGVTADPDAEVRPVPVPIWKGRRLSLSWFHAVVGGYVVAAVPQFFYLATRSSTFRWGTLARGDLKPQASASSLFDVHLSDYVPSLLGYRLGEHVDVSLDWLLLGLAFAIPFFAIVVSLRKERRVSRLCFHGMYLMLSLSVMAKGLPGLAMPVLGLAGFWIVTAPIGTLRGKGGIRRFAGWNWDKVKRLDLGRGLGLFALTGAPWYVAMIVRHGNAFFNRFFIHDHLKRVSSGVHGDTGTFGYVVHQFGYAAFPWAAIVPFALVAWFRYAKREGASPRERNDWIVRAFCASWAIMSFGLLAMMVTKFHHYTFPLLPPVAILVGLFLWDLWRGEVRRVAPVALVAIAIVAIVARDLVDHPDAPKGVLRGYAQLVGLFIYKYSRPYPSGPEWDFHVPIAVFSALFALGFASWIPRRLRRFGIVATILLALAFGHWLTQHYMIQLAPHWTQKHLIDDYYARRGSPAERLVAFQMNWKGENFYTGNRVVVYVSTKNREFEKWVERHKGERHFFITEHQRFKRMSDRTSAASGPLEESLDLCNKYKMGWADRL